MNPNTKKLVINQCKNDTCHVDKKKEDKKIGFFNLKYENK
jgi:hypothetical protein